MEAKLIAKAVSSSPGLPGNLGRGAEVPEQSIGDTFSELLKQLFSGGGAQAVVDSSASDILPEASVVSKKVEVKDEVEADSSKKVRQQDAEESKDQNAEQSKEVVKEVAVHGSKEVVVPRTDGEQGADEGGEAPETANQDSQEDVAPEQAAVVPKDSNPTQSEVAVEAAVEGVAKEVVSNATENNSSDLPEQTPENLSLDALGQTNADTGNEVSVKESSQHKATEGIRSVQHESAGGEAGEAVRPPLLDLDAPVEMELSDKTQVPVVDPKGGAVGLARMAAANQLGSAGLALEGAGGKQGASLGTESQLRSFSNGTFGLDAEMKKSGLFKDGASNLNKLPASTQDKIVERIQQMLESAAKGRNGSTLVVRLDPPELGEMTVKVSQRSDQVFARIIPESREVESVLRERLPEIMQLLANAGLKVENMHVSIGADLPESELFKFSESFNSNNGAGSKYSASSGDESRDGSQGAELASAYLSSRVEQGGWVA